MKKTVILSFALLVGLAPSLTFAKTRYVTDQFQVTIRTGESTGHRVKKMLSSGTPVEIMSENAESGYSQIRMSDGSTGYVLTRMLDDLPAARDRLTKAQAELKELRGNPEELGNQLATIRQQFDELTRDYTNLQSENEALKKQLVSISASAKNAIAIAKERDQLRQTSSELQSRVTELETLNKNLEEDEFRRWFMVGAAVMLVGVLLGLLLPKMRGNRRSGSLGFS